MTCKLINVISLAELMLGSLKSYDGSLAARLCPYLSAWPTCHCSEGQTVLGTLYLHVADHAKHQ